MRNPHVALVAGILLLLSGGFLSFTGDRAASSLNPELLCREKMGDEGQDARDVEEQCRDASFAAAILATDPVETDRRPDRIGLAKISESVLDEFLLGMGLLVTIAGAARTFVRR